MALCTYSISVGGVKMNKIKICDDFTDAPGGRYITEGECSGEEFRDSILWNRLCEAEKKGIKLDIDFDGCYGFGTSFLEEAFGGLVRKYKKRGVLNLINIISTEDDTIAPLIEKYIKTAEANL